MKNSFFSFCILLLIVFCFQACAETKQILKDEVQQTSKDIGLERDTFVSKKDLSGFDHFSVRPGVNLKSYRYIIVDEVDFENVQSGDGLIEERASREEVKHLANEIKKRFRRILGAVMPVLGRDEDLKSENALEVRLKLTKAVPTDVDGNIAADVFLFPTGGVSNAVLGLDCVIVDYRTKEKLITVTDVHEGTGFEKSASVSASESMDRWGYAYVTMDLWADRFAAFLAQQRGQEYKSPLEKKL